MSTPFPFATIFDLIVTPGAAQSPVIMAATDRGIWQADDGGIAWRPLLDGMLTTTLGISPDRTIMFAGIPGGITRSTDAGATWKTTMLPFPAVAGTGFALSPGFSEDGRAMLATLEDGLFVSLDHGTTWKRSTIGLFDPKLIDVVIPHPGMAWVAAESGVFASADGGDSWMDCDLPLMGDRVSCLAGCGDLVLVGTEQGDVLISHDAGSSWQGADAMSCSDPVLAMKAIETGSGHSVVAIAGATACGVFAMQRGNWAMIGNIPLPAAPVCLALALVRENELHIALALADGSLVVQVDAV
jgi:photosystem II stability/assembly factor-like uncharacterized protein